MPSQDELETFLIGIDSLSQRDSSYRKIVGVRYNRGETHLGEYVQLTSRTTAVRAGNLQGYK